jgi:hypothetical protein
MLSEPGENNFCAPNLVERVFRELRFDGVLGSHPPVAADDDHSHA